MDNSAIETLKTLLLTYVAKWISPETTDLQQCLQAVTPEQRYELVAGVHGWTFSNVIYIAAACNHTGVLKCILSSFAVHVRFALLIQQKWHGRTALHKAAIQGHAEAIKCMLEGLSTEMKTQFMNIQDKTSKTALAYAQPFDEAFQALLFHMQKETNDDVDFPAHDDNTDQQTHENAMALRIRQLENQLKRQEKEHHQQMSDQRSREEAMALKIRQLESQQERQESEHHQQMSEIKVENQTLKDDYKKLEQNVFHQNQLILQHGEEIQGKADKVKRFTCPSDAPKDEQPQPTTDAVPIVDDSA